MTALDNKALESGRAPAPPLTHPHAAATPRQTTLASCVRCSGVGLHSGVPISMTLHPAPADSGITFRRTDLPGTPTIPARWDAVTDSTLCTTLARGAAHVATVEHLLSALAGMAVDNAVVDLDGPEVPIMDGSAAPFVFLIECAGLTAQTAPRRALRLCKTVTASDGDRRVTLAPPKPGAAESGLSLTFTIDFDSPAIARQSWTVALADAGYKRDVARARTFGFLADVDRLRAAGLARGGSLDNAIVVDHGRVVNEGGLRYSNEFVRHKILDCVGDLYLAGAPIIGDFTGERSGHALNHELLRTLFAEPAAWVWEPALTADPSITDPSIADPGIAAAGCA